MNKQNSGFIPLGPSSLSVKGRYGGSDWCHICGHRSQWHAEFFYPQNAEHSRNEGTAETSEYVRICSLCLCTANAAIELDHRVAKADCDLCYWCGDDDEIMPDGSSECLNDSCPGVTTNVRWKGSV